MAVTLCVLLSAVPGNESRLVDYEDAVLDLLPAHGARLLSRVRSIDRTESPLEVQVIEFPSEDALEQYLQDPVRLALIGTRDEVVARTEVLRVDVV